MPLETLAQKLSDWGYDGVELGSGGDHFDVEACSLQRPVRPR